MIWIKSCSKNNASKLTVNGYEGMSDFEEGVSWKMNHDLFLWHFLHYFGV